MQHKAFLILDDGTVYQGVGFGAPAPHVTELGHIGPIRFSGEVVFNTGMAGYHEILTDPSYTGQMVLMTYPHIGNYGCMAEWNENGPEEGRETRTVKAAGFIVRSLYSGPLPPGRISLHEFLNENNISGIQGIDTRGLTLKLRDEGSRNGIIVRAAGDDLSAAEKRSCMDFLGSIPSMAGQNLVTVVGTIKPEIINEEGTTHIALIDCGVKMNIIRELRRRDCKITLFPSTVTEEQLMAVKPDGVLFGNGPGDPAVLTDLVDLARNLMGKIPVFGICLGHQIIGQALGGSTYKMKFGHHGCNQPVRDEKTGKVFVTSQNHGFAVDDKTLPEGVTVRFRNANDQSVEGLEYEARQVLCVQFHPEASPGPVDCSWIFSTFVDIAKGV
jgi:carbamoyl-phosphate synthase small subunit